jgi:hypothetical protein
MDIPALRRINNKIEGFMNKVILFDKKNEPLVGSDLG